MNFLRVYLKNVQSFKKGLNIFVVILMQCCGSGRIRNFGQIWILSGTEINVSDQDSNPEKIGKKEPYFQAEISWFHMIIQYTYFTFFK
jgi:hypothetical protein